LKREFLIKEINAELSILRYRIESLSRSNMHDLNIICEHYIKEILNIIFDWRLINSNEKNQNNTAIDLEDVANSIAVQVTSTNKKNKIQDTLTKFFGNILDQQFTILFIFILGKKQRSYNNLIINEGFPFDPKINIIDFGDVINKLHFLPDSKIEKIVQILKNDKLQNINIGNTKVIFKSIIATRNKIVKNLVRDLQSREDLLISHYDPSYSIISDDLIIRSIADRKYPDYDEDSNVESPSWYKVFSYSIKEYFIEVILWCSCEVVVNENSEWNYLNDRDQTELSSNLRTVRAGIIQRIPYENIVDIEMVNDAPIIYVEYKNGKPYSEEIPFVRAYYRSERDCKYTYYFEMSKLNKDL